MPHFVVDKIGDALNRHQKSINGSTVLILGVAYKRDIDDMRESPALDVMAPAAREGRARPVRRSVRADAAGARLARRLRHGDRAADAGGARRGRLRRDPHRPPHGRLRHGRCDSARLIVDTRNAIAGSHDARVQARRAARRRMTTARRRRPKRRRSRGMNAHDAALLVSPSLIAYVYVGYPLLLARVGARCAIDR